MQAQPEIGGWWLTDRLLTWVWVHVFKRGNRVFHGGPPDLFQNAVNRKMVRGLRRESRRSGRR